MSFMIIYAFNANNFYLLSFKNCIKILQNTWKVRTLYIFMPLAAYRMNWSGIMFSTLSIHQCLCAYGFVVGGILQPACYWNLQLYKVCVCLFYQADFPSVAGLIEDLDSQLDADDITGQDHKEKKYYIDTVNIKIPRKGMEMTGFLRDGMGECWL